MQWHRDFEHEPTHAEQQQARMVQLLGDRARAGRVRHDYCAIRATRCWARREQRRAAASGTDLTEWRRMVESDLERDASPLARLNEQTPADALRLDLDESARSVQLHTADRATSDHAPPPELAPDHLLVRTLTAAPCAPNRPAAGIGRTR